MCTLKIFQFTYAFSRQEGHAPGGLAGVVEQRGSARARSSAAGKSARAGQVKRRRDDELQVVLQVAILRELQHQVDGLRWKTKTL